MQVYLYFIKVRLILQLNYRVEAVGGLIMSLIPLSTLVFLWRTTFPAGQLVEGLTREQMVLYSILSVALKDVFYYQTQDRLLTAVQDGNIAIDMMRPYNFLGRLLAEDIALALSNLAKRFLPLVLVACFLFEKLPWPSPATFCLFAASCAFSYGLLWCLSATVGMAALWTHEAGNLGMVKDAIVRILSGSIIPIWFFPESLQAASRFLPFQYTFQTPIAIAIGRISPHEALSEMSLQLLWVLALFGIVAVLWGAGRRYTSIQGG